MTFWRAQERARQAGGKLVLRIEDLDRDRCRTEFRDAIVEDFRWFGLRWDEGPDVGGAFAPYTQSERRENYLAAWKKLRDAALIYPCTCSRQDVLQSAGAPHHENEEPVYPGTCRPKTERSATWIRREGVTGVFACRMGRRCSSSISALDRSSRWPGEDFGDFIVWRKDDVPAYQLAVVADDAAMQITEVVRGADLLLSTFRQLLIYRALGLAVPQFYHTELITDSSGQRLAKRHDALSLRELRNSGVDPEELRRRYAAKSRIPEPKSQANLN